MAVREPFTVRLLSDLIAAVRARAHSGSAAGLAEEALRLYLATSQADQERAAVLSGVEETLVQRLDKRLGRAVEAMRTSICWAGAAACLDGSWGANRRPSATTRQAYSTGFCSRCGN